MDKVENGVFYVNAFSENAIFEALGDPRDFPHFDHTKLQQGDFALFNVAALGTRCENGQGKGNQ
jgi:hypothetical protein